MNIKEIKELLANADVRQVLEEQIQKAVEDKKAELDAEVTKLAEQKKAMEKEAFIFRKTILAKSNLYEAKLRDFYELKFNDAKKKLGKELFEFVNEPIKNLTKTIEEDIKASSASAKLQEAFGRAVRELAPFINVNELAENNQAKNDELKKKLNETIKKLKIAEEKAIAGDLHSLVVSECSGYPTEKVALLYETVVKMAPKSLTEGKEALEAAKMALREKENELAKKATPAAPVSTEQKTPAPVAAPETSTQRNKLKVIAETINTEKAKVITENKTTATKNDIISTALDYDILSSIG